MTQHLSEETLRRFAEGRLGERQAVEVAVHIDACPQCAARAVALDPLAPVFAAVPDPRLPEGFEAAVLAAIEREDEPAGERPQAALASPPPPPFGLFLTGSGLIAVAAVLMAIGGAPMALVWKLAALARALWVTIDFTLRCLPASSAPLAVGAALVLAGSLAALRLIDPRREIA
jgi:anti-sigma factor RsiW